MATSEPAELHPPSYWLDRAREHEQRGERDLARLCLSAADSSLYRQQIEINAEWRRINGSEKQ